MVSCNCVVLASFEAGLPLPTPGDSQSHDYGVSKRGIIYFSQRECGPALKLAFLFQHQGIVSRMIMESLREESFIFLKENVIQKLLEESHKKALPRK